MRILITGASGLLGLNLALEAAKDHDVVGTVKDHLINTDAFTVLHTDLLAPGAVEEVLNESQPDWIIHCAALADVDACEIDPLQAQQLNSELPRKLATYVGRGGARLLHVSTDAVFDGRRGNYTERDTPNPLSVYARTKLAGERAVADTNPDAIIARVNLFGWSLSGTRSLAEFFFNNLVDGNRVFGFTDVYFCPLLVNDLAQIFLKMLGGDLRGLYHVLSRECVSKYEFGAAIAQRFGFDQGLITPTSIESGNLKAKRSPRLTLKVDKLTQALGQAPPDLSTGLDGFYTLYQQGYPQRIRQLADS
jgi:dTDP-4-dehydrorhamnose reductase